MGIFPLACLLILESVLVNINICIRKQLDPDPKIQLAFYKTVCLIYIQ